LVGAAGVAGATDGTGAAARFDSPVGVASDGAGNLFVADASNNAIRKVVIATGAVTTLVAAGAHLSSPFGVVSDGTGNLFVTDTYNHTIRKVVIASGAITTLAGSAGQFGGTDGKGSAARFYYPSSITTDGAGNLFVADTDNHAVRKIVIATGAVTTFAGTLGQNGSVDGAAAESRFNYPSGVALDGAGSLFVTDANNQSIRKVIIATGAVTTLVGSTEGYADGTGGYARFRYPFGIASDGAGDLFVGDTNNDCIRKIVVATGTVTTFAGAASHAGNADGTGTAASFTRSNGVATDGSGNLYVVDSDNQTIRKVVIATGVVTTLAGSVGQTGSTDGTGTAARFYRPSGIASDGAGNLYLADGNTIRKIAVATGAVSTVIGSAGRVGVSPGPLPASLNAPYGVTVLPTGDLAITDTGENAVLLGRF
jgi:streptogramin lyase